MKTELSPFAFGHVVNLLAFTNREEDLLRLKRNLIHGVNTIMISPRRWGKSSLVAKAIQEINQENPTYKTIQIDLFSINSEEEFLSLLAKEVIKASSSQWDEWVQAAKTFFSKLSPKVKLNIQPEVDFNIAFDWKELKKNSAEILNLAEKIAQEKGIKFIICIDEFQNLAQLKDYGLFENKLRAEWQHHKNVVYCLYGSKRHMMMDIFTNTSKPFYKFGDLFLLQKIKKEKWVDFIVSNFKRSQKEIPIEFAEKIPEIMRCHSWYVQQLSYYVWSECRGKVDKEVFNQAITLLVNSNMPLFQERVEELSLGQVNLIKAIVVGAEQLSSKQTIEKYHLGTSASVTKNKNILIQRDLLNEEAGKVELLDPVFELWFRKTFFNKNYTIE